MRQTTEKHYGDARDDACQPTPKDLRGFYGFR
jgi:hypothetical protein